MSLHTIRNAIKACRSVATPENEAVVLHEHFTLEFPDAAGAPQTTVQVRSTITGQLVVCFHVEPHSTLDLFYSEESEDCGNGMLVNKGLLDEARRILPETLTALSNFLVNVEENGTFNTTVYTGHRLGGALAALVATVSPPHAVILFGTPAFANKRLEELIVGKAAHGCEILNLQLADGAMTYGRDKHYVHMGNVAYRSPTFGWISNPNRFTRWALEWWHASDSLTGSDDIFDFEGQVTCH